MSTIENPATRRCPNCEQQIDAASESCPACGKLFAAAPCDDHPEREATGACVICGRRVCADDAGERPYFVCAEHTGIPVFEGWAQLYTTSEEIEAQLIRDNLEAHGIDAEVLSQKDRTLSFDLGEFTPVRVLVPAFAWAEAQAVLRQHMDSRGEVAFACPACGAAYEPGDVTCRACGADLPRATA